MAEFHTDVFAGEELVKVAKYAKNMKGENSQNLYGNL